VGGRERQGYKFNAVLSFLTTEGLEEKEELNVRVIEYDEEWEEGRIPIILGTDFLREKKYKLFCDLANEVAFLEKGSEFFTAA